MACCPNGSYNPLIIDCGGNVRPLQSNETLVIDGNPIPAVAMTEDVTIYVAPGGSDTTGDGSAAKPYKTLQGAHGHVITLIPGSFDIYIDLAKGTITESIPFNPSWLWGHKVHINGQRTNLGTHAVSNFRDFGTSVTSNFGLTGTAAVNDTPAASGDTTLTIDTVSLDTTDTDLVPLYSQFTIAGETNNVVHMVTARTPSSTSPTTDITFVPATSTGVLDNAVITFLARPGNPDYFTAYFASLQYFDCDIDFSSIDTSDFAEGMFVAITAVSGGTNAQSLLGLHKIIGWNSSTEVATVRVWQCTGVTEEPSGSINMTAGRLLHSVITWEDSLDDQAIEIRGGHGGIWSELVIEGNHNQFESRRGVICAGGFIASGGNVGVHNFDVGVECAGGGSIEWNANFISKIWSIGASASTGFIRIAFGMIVSGCGAQSIWSQAGGVVSMFSSTCVASLRTYGVLVEKTGSADVNLTKYYYEGINAIACIRAEELGMANAQGCSFTGITTARSTATLGQTNPVP